MLSLCASTMLVAGCAEARDIEAARKAREERLKALKAAAADMKETGIGEAAFADSEYSVSDDKTPNIHSRQVGGGVVVGGQKVEN
eukprot:evm.model.scf_396.2 EVM.evm.TU.scf_396.2   scf_396:27207-28734(-)